jgi:hypothetical protein
MVERGARFVALFAKQDSFGLRPWLAYAKDARLDDSSRFQNCMSARNTADRVDSGLALGARYHVHSTPTVIINGWRCAHPPTEVVNAIDAVSVRTLTPCATLPVMIPPWFDHYLGRVHSRSTELANPSPPPSITILGRHATQICLLGSNVNRRDRAR